MEEQETTTVEETDVTEESSTSEETEETAELEQESSESSEEEPGEETTETKPKGNRVQARISELVQERKQAAFEAEFYRKQYEESQRQPAAQEKEVELEKVNAPGLPPDRYDFDSDADFKAAVGSYQDNSTNYQRQLIREEMQRANQGTQEEQARQRQQGEQQEAAKRLKTIEETGVDQYQDFNEVAFIPQEVAGFVTQFDNAVDIAYHWGKNPEERTEIVHLARTNPTLAAAKIGALDAKFAAKEKKTTNAPPPIKPVGSNGRASTQPDPGKDYAAWAKWRNETEAK